MLALDVCTGTWFQKSTEYTRHVSNWRRSSHYSGSPSNSVVSDASAVLKMSDWRWNCLEVASLQITVQRWNTHIIILFNACLHTSRWISPNRWKTLLWLFPVLFFFLLPTPSSNRAADIHALWLKWRGSTQGRSLVGLGRWVTFLGGNVPQKPPKRGVNRSFPKS